MQNLTGKIFTNENSIVVTPALSLCRLAFFHQCIHNQRMRAQNIDSSRGPDMRTSLLESMVDGNTSRLDERESFFLNDKVHLVALSITWSKMASISDSDTFFVTKWRLSEIMDDQAHGQGLLWSSTWSRICS